MSVLLKDIAEKTGFSINTVSRALRDDKKLSESTRKTIRETAEMMGYVRNSAAALMRKGTSNEIGIISGDSSNPFFAEVVRGIEETAKQAGFRILLLNTDEDPEREADYMKMFVSMKVAGILIVPVFHDDMCQKIYRTISVPYYFVGRHVEGITGHSILHSDIQSQYDVTQSLINKGHRRILYGEVFLDMPEPDRRLFWTRLRNSEGRTLLVSTVHLTWQGNADEVATGTTYRHREAIIVGEALKELVLEGEGALICGDFNDPLHPVETIKGITGMKEVFWILGQMAPVTFPCSPPSEELNLVESIDKMMINDRLRVLMADSPHYRLAGAAASDHWSVEALFEY